MAKTKKLMALKNTANHCKGVFYELLESEAAELVKAGLFLDLKKVETVEQPNEQSK